jgi:hypothetical protein
MKEEAGRDMTAWTSLSKPASYPEREGGSMSRRGVEYRLNQMTVLQPLLCRRRSCLSQHWSEVRRRQIAWLLAGRSPSRVQGERERGLHTTLVSSELQGISN